MNQRWTALCAALGGLIFASACGPSDRYQDILGGDSGGAGGGSGSGGGSGAALEWTAEAPASGGDCVAAFTYSLPAWLSFKSPSAGRTTQTSDKTLCVGFGPDAPRARNVGPADAPQYGLSVESARTNLVSGSDAWSGAKWGSGSMTAKGSAADPAGGTAATTFSSTGDQYSNYTAPPVLSRAASSWLRGDAGAAPYAHFRHHISGPFMDINTTEWRRYSVVQAKDEVAEVALETRDRPVGAGVIAGATSFAAFGAQMEAGAAYPSSYIPTKDGPVTRAAEVLSSAVPAELLPGGFLDVELSIAPSYAEHEQGVDHDLLFIDADNRLVLEAKTHQVALIIGGDVIRSDALTFEREQALVITAKSSKDGRELTVAGASTGSGTKTGAAAGPIALSTSIYILGSASGAEECADLRSIRFH